MIIGLIVIAIVWSFSYKLDVYSITPGISQPVGPLITVKGHPSDTRRDIYLTDVYLTQLNVWQWLSAQIHSSNEQLINGGDLVGRGVPTSQLTAQGYLEMSDSQNYAKAAAMTALHKHVGVALAGATVTAVPTASPASTQLAVADRIVGADGRAVASPCDLARALASASPGEPVPLRVQPAVISPSGTITYLHAVSRIVRVAAVPASDRKTSCPGAPTRHVWLGIGVEPAYAWMFPVDVSVDTAYIGGPSAGLAMTLGIMDALSPGPLTGGAKVAATGTIDPFGNVGDVGGVAEKTVAVERAGATLFLVPPQELEVANGARSPGLTVVAVSTLNQALAAIHSYHAHSAAASSDASRAAAAS